MYLACLTIDADDLNLKILRDTLILQMFSLTSNLNAAAYLQRLVCLFQKNDETFFFCNYFLLVKFLLYLAVVFLFLNCFLTILYFSFLFRLFIINVNDV